ncbi:MAG TPA: DUF6537 domain-containing protein [Geminicoccaceae bacterium]
MARAPRSDHRAAAEAALWGPWLRPVLRALAHGRRLRGTPFDPFGWLGERRTERRLIDHFEAVLEELCRDLTPANHGLAVSIARLPLTIRGFGPVKNDNLRRFGEQEARLLEAWRRPAPEIEAAE